MASQLPSQGAKNRAPSSLLTRQRRIVRIDAQTPFLIYVGVAHGDDDRVDGNIHHDHIENLQADANGGDEHHIEAAGTDCDGLEESGEGLNTRAEIGDGMIAYLYVLLASSKDLVVAMVDSRSAPQRPPSQSR